MKTFLFFSLLFSSALGFAQDRTFSVCSMNVDGLPASVLGITVNEDSRGAEGAKMTGKKMNERGWDIIGVNEDFNYHSEVYGELSANYDCGTWRGEISLTSLPLFSYRFNTDGLNAFWRKTANDPSLGSISLSQEKWTEWVSYNGLTDACNDGLARKGFRYYLVTFGDGTTVDLYILHADAGSAEGDVSCRKEQFEQLRDVILKNTTDRPVIVMGDTNNIYSFDKQKEYFIDPINASGWLTIEDVFIELKYAGKYPEYNGTYNNRVPDEQLDKIFYINNSNCDYTLQPESFEVVYSFVDDNGQRLSDHWPVASSFSIHSRRPSQEDLAHLVRQLLHQDAYETEPSIGDVTDMINRMQGD